MNTVPIPTRFASIALTAVSLIDRLVARVSAERPRATSGEPPVDVRVPSQRTRPLASRTPIGIA